MVTVASSPKEIVLFAYNAANRGRFAEATALVAPKVRKDLEKAHAVSVAAGEQLRRTLRLLRNRRGDAAARSRKTLRVLIRSNRTMVGLQIHSP
jgi:hypothetical protein